MRKNTGPGTELPCIFCAGTISPLHLGVVLVTFKMIIIYQVPMFLSIFQTYFKTQVKASMQRSSAYHADLVLDNNGTVFESQCECKRGVGPDSVCKHRIILLYGITRHCAGEDVITQTSKTSLLQTHHAVKPSKGSPKKAGNRFCLVLL